ncbi:MAG: A24 family peptidase [Rhodanobacter sp.]
MNRSRWVVRSRKAAAKQRSVALPGDFEVNPSLGASMSDPLPALAFLLCELTILSDLYAHRVRNAWLLAAVLLGGGWLVAVWVQGAAGPPWMALEGMLAGLLALLPFYVVGWMGAGDVKFFATIGFLLGSKALLPIWIIASLIAGAHALIIVLVRQRGLPPMGVFAVVYERARESRWWQRVLAARQGRRGLPYAAYLSVGALLTLRVPGLTHW